MFEGKSCSLFRAFTSSGCGCSSVPSPSSVVISTPVIVPAGVTQERIARPWASTVQAPHWPSPQPNLGPRRLRSSLSTYSSGVAGSTSTVCALPLTVSIMVAIVTSIALRDVPNPLLEGTGQGRHRRGRVLINRVPMPKDRLRKRERGQLLDTLIGLRHVRRVLRIRAAQAVVDVPHRIAHHEQRADRIEHTDVARGGNNL